MIVGHIGGSSSGGYEIQKSLRFRASASAYLSRTPTVAGNRKTWTWSGWVKRGDLASTRVLFSSAVGTDDNNHLWIGFEGPSGKLLVQSWNGGYFHTNAVFRDPSAWCHVVILTDTAQATAANRLRVFFNGVEQTGTQPIGYPALNADLAINSAQAHGVGYSNYSSGSSFFDGYLTEVNFIDGQALDPSYFGQVSAETGSWIPKKYTGTYGTNGFYLPFSDNTSATTLAYDKSGNGNNWTPNNISTTAGATYDSMTDVPTLTSATAANYCVGNPLYKPSTHGQMSSRNANLEWGQAATNAVSSMAATFAMSTGKWYWEVTVGGTVSVSALGIQTDVNTAWRGQGTVLYQSNGQKIIGGTSPAAYGSSYTNGDVIGFSYDADAGTLTCYKNNVSQGVIYSGGAGNSWLACAHDDNAGAGVTYYHAFNFGQRPFAYTPPAGFKALCTKNLPDPAIKNPKKHFDVLTYVGNGVNAANALTVTGAKFQPGFSWLKSRSIIADHVLQDVVRSLGNFLMSNATAAEQVTGGGDISSYNADGFTVSYNNARSNQLNAAYVSWLWKAGGAPVTNNAGSIQSQVSANSQAGFSIVTYTGTGANATVGHGLGVAPKMVIVKRRNGTASQWAVYHTSIGAANALYLNLTNAQAAAIAMWNSAAPTSSAVSIGTDATVNGNAYTYVAYCFAEIPGYSKIGSYTGNGSADGPFVHCGFRPRYVLIKRTDAAGQSWLIEDSSRNPTNATGLDLIANGSDAEVNNTSVMDFVSNGFKLRNTFGGYNTNGGTYIFYAVAEQPFQFANAR